MCAITLVSVTCLEALVLILPFPYSAEHHKKLHLPDPHPSGFYVGLANRRYLQKTGRQEGRNQVTFPFLFPEASHLHPSGVLPPSIQPWPITPPSSLPFSSKGYSPILLTANHWIDLLTPVASHHPCGQFPEIASL